MHFGLIMVAWLCFEIGFNNFIYDTYKFCINKEPDEPSIYKFLRWLISALAFSVWYYLLFVLH